MHSTPRPGIPHLLRVALLTALVTTATEARSPWTKAEGEGFFQLSAYTIGPYDRLYSNGGPDVRLNREISDTTIEVYGEYGVTDRWTLVAVLPWKKTEAADLVSGPTLTPTTGVAGTLDEPGNVVFGARRQFVRGPYVLAGQLDVELPTGSFDEITGLRTGYDAFTFTPTVSAGKGFDRAYVFGSAGIGLRTDDYSSDWRVGLEGGYRFFDRLWLIGLVDVRQSFENGDVELPRANLETGLYVNDQEYFAYGVKLAVDVTKRFGAQATFTSASEGNNVPRAGLAGLGLFYRLPSR